ncbi:hypothetical protein [Oerskovia sp. USHLN155]|uniref:hypothetical protein n=1 Tax=Oerskovia sp. USHLN155 TaxID=3081288 RepID=UPI003019C27A
MVVMSGVLVGCGGPEVPGPAPTPSVVWSAGEPTGELESDPWVQAVRAAALPEAVAFNGLDTRSSSLHATWTPDAIRELQWTLGKFSRENNDNGAYRVPGPRPFDPVSVEVAPDGKSARVVGCTVFDWSLTRDDAAFDDDDADPVSGRFEVVRQTDGSYLVDQFVPSGTRCESQNLTVGTFDPLPDGEWEYWQEDILKGGFAEDPSEAP